MKYEGIFKIVIESDLPEDLIPMNDRTIHALLDVGLQNTTIKCGNVSGLAIEKNIKKYTKIFSVEKIL